MFKQQCTNCSNPDLEIARVNLGRIVGIKPLNVSLGLE